MAKERLHYGLAPAQSPISPLVFPENQMTDPAIGGEDLEKDARS